MRDRKRFWLVLSAFLAVVGVVAFIAIFPDVPAPSCAFRRATGLYCPGCGSTRAVRRLVQGDLLGALRCNALAIGLLPVLVYFLVLYFVELWKGRFPYRRGMKTFSFVLVAATILFFVLRNIPLDVFDILRPI